MDKPRQLNLLLSEIKAKNYIYKISNEIRTENYAVQSVCVETPSNDLIGETILKFDLRTYLPAERFGSYLSEDLFNVESKEPDRGADLLNMLVTAPWASIGNNHTWAKNALRRALEIARPIPHMKLYSVSYTGYPLTPGISLYFPVEPIKYV